MKRIATLAALPLILAACGGLPVATVTVTQEPPVTVTAEPEPQPTTQRSAPRDPDQLVRLLETTDPIFGYLPENDLVELAVTICDRLGEGFAATTLGNLAIDSGFTREQAAALIAASIVVYCPWEEGNVR